MDFDFSPTEVQQTNCNILVTCVTARFLGNFSLKKMH